MVSPRVLHPDVPNPGKSSMTEGRTDRNNVSKKRKEEKRESEVEKQIPVKGHVFILFHNLEMVGMTDRRSSRTLSCLNHCFLYGYKYQCDCRGCNQVPVNAVRTCKRTHVDARHRQRRPSASWDHKNCSDTEIITQPTGVFNFRSKIKRSCCERREIINR